MNEKTEPGAGRPPGEPATREKILDASRDEFVEHGLQGARMQRIAERSGANKAMIYYYFGSKNELYEQVLRDVLRLGLTRVSGIMSDCGGIEGKVGELVSFYCGIYGDQRLMRMLLRELADGAPRLKKIIGELRREMSGFPLRELWPSMLEKEKASGQVRDVDPLHALVSLIGMSAGYFLLRPVADTILGQSPEDSERFGAERKEKIIDLYLNGLLSR